MEILVALNKVLILRGKSETFGGSKKVHILYEVKSENIFLSE